MSREEKKRKLIDFINRRKEDRLKDKEKILERTKEKYNWTDKDINKEKKPAEADKAFILNSKRKKEKRKKYLELKERQKEEKQRERQEQIKRKQEEREKRLKQERERKREREKRKLEERLERKNIRAENKQNLLNFIKYKQLLNKLEKEKALLYTNLIIYKKAIEKERRQQLIEIAKKLEKERKELIQKKKEKPPVLVKEVKIVKPEKEEILKKKEEQKKIKIYLDNISKLVIETEKSPLSQLNNTKSEITNFINLKKKEIVKKKPVKVVPEKPKIVPKEKVKVPIHKEPFNLKVFLRRNIFKFVFMALILAWLVELFLYLRKLVSPEERLKLIVGEMAEVRPAPEKKKEVIEEEKLVYYTKEKIDIEGKRDPFSTGRLTMEIMKKPTPTNIIYAKKPDVISIIKPQKFVSILKPEEKITIPEKPELPKIPTVEKPTIAKGSPVEKPTIAKGSPVEKPTITKPEQISPSTKLSEIEKVPEVKISPFIAPQKECKLNYRGRMILEGVEYFFIEGEKKTYKVTIGDEVEGYRLLKKDEKKLILSKEGLIYSIDIK
ncbi:MAG: hypothetical protein NC816_02685 [Candidatus Omnitrophica bacterium]|nr:hypothetical protein [Candidatus Omnitrophota bacterium]